MKPEGTSTREAASNSNRNTVPGHYVRSGDFVARKPRSNLTISLDTRTLLEVDALISRCSYRSRSDLIQMALNEYLKVEHEGTRPPGRKNAEERKEERAIKICNIFKQNGIACVTNQPGGTAEIATGKHANPLDVLSISDYQWFFSNCHLVAVAWKKLYGDFYSELVRG